MVQLCLNRHLNMRNGPGRFKYTDGTGVSYYLRGLAVWPAAPPSTYLNVVTVYSSIKLVQTISKCFYKILEVSMVGNENGV